MAKIGMIEGVEELRSDRAAVVQNLQHHLRINTSSAEDETFIEGLQQIAENEILHHFACRPCPRHHSSRVPYP